MKEYIADRYEDGILVACVKHAARRDDGESAGTLVCFPDEKDGTAAHVFRMSMPPQGTLICFSEDGEERLCLLCRRPVRPEGRRVLFFEALGTAFPYVHVEGTLGTADSRSFVLLPADEKKNAAIRERFDNLFKKGT